MSVSITPKGDLVITLRSMGSPEEYLALKKSLNLVLGSDPNDTTYDFVQHHVLNLLQELELDEEQVKNGLRLKYDDL